MSKNAVQLIYEQRQNDWPTSLKNLASAYIIVNELQLVVPPGVLATDYRLAGNNLTVDIAWHGRWIDQLRYDSQKAVPICCFIKAAKLGQAGMKIKYGGANSIAVQYLADVLIEDLVITKCRYEQPAQLNADTLLATWDTYCYFVETNQLGMMITAHILSASTTLCDDGDEVVTYKVNRVTRDLK